MLNCKKASFVLALVLCFGSFVICDIGKANDSQIYELPEIIVRDDFQITSGIIEKTGDIYTLTTDLVDSYVIEIQSSNIVFDGGGHKINTSSAFSPGIALKTVTNVTVKNLEIIGTNYYSIWVRNSSNCNFNNLKTSKALQFIAESNNNTITGCNLGRLFVGRGGGANNNVFTNNSVLTEMSVSGKNNMFYRNNFFFKKLPRIYPENFWDNGSIGNFWPNYITKHPNASEIGTTGIGDTPYIIDVNWLSTDSYPNATNIDNYPLMEPVKIESIPEFSSGFILVFFAGVCLVIALVKKKWK